MGLIKYAETIYFKKTTSDLLSVYRADMDWVSFKPNARSDDYW